MPFWERKPIQRIEVPAVVGEDVPDTVSEINLQTILYSSSSDFDMYIGIAIERNLITPGQVPELTEQWKAIHRS
jgi:hypothetical protein